MSASLCRRATLRTNAQRQQRDGKSCPYPCVYAPLSLILRREKAHKESRRERLLEGFRVEDCGPKFCMWVSYFPQMIHCIKTCGGRFQGGGGLMSRHFLREQFKADSEHMPRARENCVKRVRSAVPTSPRKLERNMCRGIIKCEEIVQNLCEGAPA